MTAPNAQMRPRKTIEGPALLDFPAAQEYLGGVSRSTLKLLVWRGFLRPTRIGRRVLFSRRALDNYIDRQTRGAEVSSDSG